MATITFDTLQNAKQLKDSGFTDEQAEAQVKIIKQIMDTIDNSAVSKNDIQSLKIELESKIDTKIAELKADIIKWVVGLLIAQTTILLTVFKFLH